MKNKDKPGKLELGNTQLQLVQNIFNILEKFYNFPPHRILSPLVSVLHPHKYIDPANRDVITLRGGLTNNPAKFRKKS